MQTHTFDACTARCKSGIFKNYRTLIVGNGKLNTIGFDQSKEMVVFERIQNNIIAFCTTTNDGPGGRIGGGQFKEISFFCTPIDITIIVGKISAHKRKFGCLVISGCHGQVKLYQIFRNIRIIDV